ncbi:MULTISPECIES: hypothetical protein [unclassified Massilia]|uniref:hypothetical protein n=1 Tax=unclassified Massilia TaxID=2609279 RepID=UPI001780CA75|nr:MULTISPECIES: hypothetical protein [unclassified Massilia]MBD8529515.1 hypothetical protein [Massilia sp. CFBP 13647]MBD8672908.1 hypothetical protein [Massilia sp. CFBP 13721]
MGFPSRLRAAARDAVTAVATGELQPSRHVFQVNLHGEALCIPDRLYYNPDLLRRALCTSRGDTRLVVACLGTRHHDGYLRQECLRALLGGDEPWLLPYLLQLAGEYVVEIVEDVAEGIGRCDAAMLADFAAGNTDYLATLARRVTSYWSCYHRQAYPDRRDYPGTEVLAVLQRAGDRCKT